MVISNKSERCAQTLRKCAVFVELPLLTDFLLGQFGLFRGQNTDYSGVRRLLASDKDIDILFFDLFASGYDTIALLDQLRKIPFKGLVIALAPSLPDEEMVLQELATAGAGLHLQMLTAKGLSSI